MESEDLSLSSLSLSWHSDNRMTEIRAWGKRCAFLRGRGEKGSMAVRNSRRRRPDYLKPQEPPQNPEQQRRAEDRKVGFGDTPQSPLREDSAPFSFLLRALGSTEFREMISGREN